MNAEYDRTAAVAELDQLYKYADVNESYGTMLRHAELDDYCVKLGQNPSYWKLVEKTGSPEPLEGVFRVIGVICLASLPPVTNRGSSQKNRSTRDMRNLKQAITLTGLGSNIFEQNIDKINTIVAKFVRAIDNDTLVPSDNVLFEGHATVQAENRYFTERRHASGLSAAPFSLGVDDFGILKQHDPQYIFHCEENRVDYVVQVNGKREPIHPKAFQAGDIVETLISIVGVPIKNQRIKIIITLRGLNLLSCGLRKDARSKAASQFNRHNGIQTVQVKRRRGYLDVQEDTIGKRLKSSIVLCNAENTAEPSDYEMQ